MIVLCIATLFPYTTLFRSLVSAAAIGLHRRFGKPVRVDAALQDLARLLHNLTALRGRYVVHFDPKNQAGADRKSTRLNSSHSQISYAVFCLKKKNFLLVMI